MPELIWLMFKLTYFSQNLLVSPLWPKFINLYTCLIMTTVMTVLKLNPLMVSVIIMVLNGFGSMVFMSKLKLISIQKMSVETDFLDYCKNIIITLTMMNGVLFLRWQIKMENIINSHAQLRLGRFQVCLWLGTQSMSLQQKKKKSPTRNKILNRKKIEYSERYDLLWFWSYM